MLDIITIIAWGITYLAIVFCSFKNYKKKQKAIPLVAVVFNFAWEIIALVFSGGFWGYIVWFGLDSIIFVYTLTVLSQWRQRILCVVATLFLIGVHYGIFLVPNGHLISVFAIDLIMAIFFWISRKKLLREGKILIAVTKWIGDLTAAMAFASRSWFILLCGILVLIVNTAYLIYCILERTGRESCFQSKQKIIS